MAKLRSRQDDSFDFSKLSLRDCLWIAMDEPPNFPVEGGPGNRLKTRMDFEKAWLANREIFMDGGFQDPDMPRPYDSFMRYEPAKRPWEFWIFDCGLPKVPENQVAELQHLRELLPGEFAVAQRLAAKFPRHYTAAERETLLEVEK